MAIITTNETSDTSPGLIKSKLSQDAGEGAALRKRSRSRGARRTSIDFEKSIDLETAEDEDAGLRDEGGYKGRRACSSVCSNRPFTDPT